MWRYPDSLGERASRNFLGIAAVVSRTRRASYSPNTRCLVPASGHPPPARGGPATRDSLYLRRLNSRGLNASCLRCAALLHTTYIVHHDIDKQVDQQPQRKEHRKEANSGLELKAGVGRIRAVHDSEPGTHHGGCHAAHRNQPQRIDDARRRTKNTRPQTDSDQQTQRRECSPEWRGRASSQGH